MTIYNVTKTLTSTVFVCVMDAESKEDALERAEVLFDWATADTEEDISIEEKRHLYEMPIEELSKIVCFGYEGKAQPCTNTMDEFACRNSIKDDEAFCSECCADTTEGACCG